jgi:hypothetical protein
MSDIAYFLNVFKVGVIIMEQSRISPQYLCYVSTLAQTAISSANSISFASSLISAHNIFASVRIMAYKQPSVIFWITITPATSIDLAWGSLVDIAIDFLIFCERTCPGNMYFNPDDNLCYDMCPAGYIIDSITLSCLVEIPNC